MTARTARLRGTREDEERAILLLVIGASTAVLQSALSVVAATDHVFHPDLEQLGSALKFSKATQEVLRAATGIDDALMGSQDAARRATSEVLDLALRRLSELAPRGEDYPFLLEVAEKRRK
jgi:hypothetical protein